MAKVSRPGHFVVDGSNIATEGRSEPSLEQLNDAVLAFMEDHPGAVITVVVDATFGHRIASKEVKAFDEAVANNELVTPPAGAIGRGDAFVLTIANKAGAGVLSNDSFQEFHGDYDWLFDEGRLIGGKPVPHVGWVFVARSPVRGPKSRQSVREANAGATGTVATEAKERANRRVRAKAPSPSGDDSGVVAPAPEPAASGSGRSGRSRGGRSRGDKQTSVQVTEQGQAAEAASPAPSPQDHVNELLPFLEFVERHPIGTSCTGVVESYASHGAYAKVGDVSIYIPLRLMDSPAPRSARSVLAAGQAVTAVIVGYVADRRSIDAALPHMADAALADAARPEDGVTGKSSASAKTAATKTAATKTAATKTAATKTAATKTAATKTAATKKAATKKAATKKAVAKRAPTRKVVAPETAVAPHPAREAAPVKKIGAKKVAAERVPAKKPPAKRAATKKPPAKSTATKKPPAKNTVAHKAPANKTAANKTAAKKSATKKAPAKRAGA